MASIQLGLMKLLMGASSLLKPERCDEGSKYCMAWISVLGDMVVA